MILTDIQFEINNLNRKKNKCLQNKNDYMNSLNLANKLLENLIKSSNCLSIINEELRQYFIINNKIGDDGKTDLINEEINEIIKIIRDIIIPGINNNINNLSNKISDLDIQVNKLSGKL